LNKKFSRKNISNLAYDYFYAHDKLSNFFSANFRHIQEFRRHAELVRNRDIKREALAGILLKQNQDYGCGSRTNENIERLSQDQTCAVVTGQQVGLFSGPLYTIYKSLTAIKLAEYLSQNLPGSYVPVFWMASDDHDFAEIDHINLMAKDNRVKKIRYESSFSGQKIPASKLELTEDISDYIQQLDDMTLDSEFKSKILRHLSEAYKPGRSFSQAFGKWMTRLFQSKGLIFMDASHARLKALGSEIFKREITGDSPSTKRALETSEILRQANYHTQIQLHEGKLNLFFAENERQTIHLREDGIFVVARDRTYEKSELLSLLDANPEIFSPNVLLRPLYQDALLPTVAYVGGPGEIAYFAQMKGVYDSFSLPMPVIYPRKSVTVIEKNIDHIMEKYGVKIEAIWQDADGVIKKIAKKQIPEAVDESIRGASSHLEEDFDAVKQQIMAFEPALEKSADAALGKMKRQLKFLENKILQASKKRNNIAVRQLQRVKNSLYPGGRMQERVFNIVPFLIKYDYTFVDKLYERVGIDAFDHQVIKL
jgi:bacillithiol biosynthesis cysteine-adding enzyme BshC